MDQDQPATTSPVIKKQDKQQLTLSFPDAVKRLIDGKKVTKKEWNDEHTYGVLHEGILRLHKADNQYYNWIISDGDLMGDDWYTID